MGKPANRYICQAFCCLVPMLLADPVNGQPAEQSSATAEVAVMIPAEPASHMAEYQSASAGLDGGFGENRSELFLSLARAQLEAGNLAEASEAFQEALQALRINHGLAAESQLQVLAQYNRLLLALRDWERLDTNLHLATDIARRLYPAGDERYLGTATALASWKIRAYQTHVYRPWGDRSIQEAAEIYRVLLTQLPDNSEDALTRRATYLAARGLAYFYSAQHVAGIPVDEFQPTAASQGLSPQYCVPLILSVDGAMPAQTACNDSQIRDPEYFASQQREKNNTVRRHLGNMRQSFQEAIQAVEAEPNASLRRRVEAILNLGDANLLAEDYPRARTQYRRAWDLLSQDAEGLALREALLDQPVKALQGILDELPEDPGIQGDSPVGTVSFDVTETGRIININVGGTAAALDQQNLGAIAIRLDQSVYRPKLLDGRPVTSRITVSAADL
jgi:tetratricopeptide (TPR) repeat protein